MKSLAGFALALGLGLGANVAPAQVVDPDPNLFDGTRTKRPESIEQQKQPVVDDWEGANLIIYDSNEQGSARGGQGLAGYENPGMDMGQGSGMSAGLPIPLPISGGGAGGIGNSGLEIPEMNMPGGGGPEGDPNQMAGGGPPPPGGEMQPAEKPGEMAIGDASKRIQSAAAPLGDTEGLEKSAQQEGGDGGDNTRMKAASGAQSGVRGSGVEKGDAIPTDL